MSPGLDPVGCLSYFYTGLRSEQTRQSFKEDVLVLRVHGVINVQLQGEGGVTRCQRPEDGGIALLKKQKKYTKYGFE